MTLDLGLYPSVLNKKDNLGQIKCKERQAQIAKTLYCWSTLGPHKWKRKAKKDNLDGGSTNVPCIIISVNVKTSSLKNKKVTQNFLKGISYSNNLNFRSICPKEIT